MKLTDIINLIETSSGKVINQSVLAKSLGITRQTISNRIKNNSQVTVEELERVEEYFNLNLLRNCNLKNKDMLSIDYYPDVAASCGSGNMIFSSETEKMTISKKMIKDFSDNKNYSIINATGNSMSPTIEQDDMLIIEHWTNTQIQDNKIYVFNFNNELFIKRLSKNFDEIIIKSDNPEYRIRTLNGNTITDLQLIGKVVGIIKSL